MRMNWDPVDPIFFDIETQSAVDLKVVGSEAYLRHPSTRLSLLAAKIDSTFCVWAPYYRGEVKLPDDVILSQHTRVPFWVTHYLDRTWVAHNACNFDALAWPRLIYHVEPTFCDTIPSARAGGLPAGLDKICQFLGIGRKSDSRAMKLLMTAKYKNGQLVYPQGTPALWTEYINYNIQDVALLASLWPMLCEYGEADVMQADSIINARGVQCDLERVAYVLGLWERHADALAKRLSEITKKQLTADNIRSVPSVLAWLRKQGVQTDTLSKDFVKQLNAKYEDDDLDLDGDVTDVVLEVLSIRYELSRAAKGKLDRIQQMVGQDGRLRNSLVYHGATTGRWSGRGVQVHNLPKGEKVDVTDLLNEQWSYEHAAEYAVANKVSVSGLLSTATRPLFIAKPDHSLVISDFAGIEARCLSWLVDDQKYLEIFRDNSKDLYCESASTVYGRTITKADEKERQVFKVIELGCGYGMAAEKFAIYCKLQGVDLAAAGMTAEQCVEAYRDSHPLVAGIRSGNWNGRVMRKGGLWKDLDVGVKQVVETGVSRYIGKCAWTKENTDLVCTLPSGRRIIYRNARIVMRTPTWGGEPRPTLVYTHPLGFEKVLYGGLLTENIDQAICRDLVAVAVVRMEHEKLPICLHVHDEIVNEVPDEGLHDSARKAACVMSDPPEWAAGFPILVEGHTGKRYTKAPSKGAFVYLARDGSMVKESIK